MTRFFPGTVVAIFRLIFSQDFPAPLEPIKNVIVNDYLRDLPVDKDSLRVIQGRTCSSTPCPSNATCVDLDDGQYNCKCIPGLTLNGVECKGFVKVNAQILLKGVFTKELANKSSTEYKKYTRNVTEELTRVFAVNTNFVQVIILDVRNGSIKVDFVVVYSSKDPTKTVKEVEEVTRILNSEVKDGFIRNLEVPRDGFTIKEPPLPPTNISYGSVTKSQVLIKWDPPNFSTKFSITSYLISFHVVDESVIKTVQINPSGGLNALLNDLQSDTYYNVFVRGQNKFGEGENSTSIQVKTNKKDGQQTVLIVGVSLAVVLFIIAFLVGCLVARARRKQKMARKQSRRSRQSSINARRALGVPLSYTNRPNPDDWQEAPGSFLQRPTDEMFYQRGRYNTSESNDETS